MTSRCIFNTTSNSVVHYQVLFMKGWCLYSSSVKQCLLSVNRDQFLGQVKENGKHKTTSHLTSGLKSSLGKFNHRNSDAARTGTWNPAQATKKTSLYIDRLLSPRVNKHGNKAKWLWNTCLSWFSSISPWIHDKYNSTSFKQRVWQRKMLLVF